MPDYDELRLRIDGSAEGGYRVVATSVQGEAHGAFELPFSAEAVENFVLKMTRGRRGTRRVEVSQTDRAREFGGALFEALIRADVRDLYQRLVAQIEREQDHGLRLSLALTGAPELMDVPWEFLHHEGRFLSPSIWTPVVRYLDLPNPRAPFEVQGPLRILGIVSSPSDHAALAVEHERGSVESALRRLLDAGRVELRWLEDAALTGLRRLLMQEEFHVLHYVGHAFYDEQAKAGRVVFEDEEGRGQDVEAATLGQLVFETRKSLRLVVLNACEGALTSPEDPFSGVATSLVRQGIPAVIAMQFEVTDEAALVFAEGFYEALAAGDPVDSAVSQARMAMLVADNDVEWATPVLFMRVPDGRIFDVATETASAEGRLELDLRAEPAAVAPGGMVTWRLTARNSGSGGLHGVTVSDGEGNRVDGPFELAPGEEHESTWPEAVESERPRTVNVGGRVGDGGLVSEQASAAVVLRERPWWRRIADALPRAARQHPLAGGAAAAVVAGAVVLLLLTRDGSATDSLRLGHGVDGVAVGQGAVWVGDRGDTLAYRVDPNSLEEIATVDVRGVPDSLAVDHNRGAIWVTLMRENTVGRIDPGTDKVAETVRVGDSPEGVVIGHDAVWVANKGDGTVSRIASDGEKLTPSTGEGSEPIHLAVAENAVWATLSGSGRLAELEAQTGQPTGRSVRVEGGPRGLAFLEGLLWVAVTQRDEVVVVDPSDEKVIDHIAVGDNPREVRAGEGAIWVTSADAGEVSKIDPTAREVAATAEVGGRPHGLAVGAGYVWATSVDDGVLTRIDPDKL